MLTQEQIEARRTTIGASDSAPILGISPFKTAYQLWDEKVNGKASFTNSAMDRGNKLEPLARKEFFKMTGILMQESPTQAHPNRSWQTATPDGISFRRDQILEIKCASKEIHEMAKNKKIPDYYMSQVQHQLSVFELDQGFYFSYDGVEGAIVEVKRDQAFIDTMIEKEEKFWRCVMDKISPDHIPDIMEMIDPEWELLAYIGVGRLTEIPAAHDHIPDIMEMIDPEWELLADEWKMLCEMEERKEVVKQRLLELSGNKNAMGYGIKLQQVSKKGNVDYSAIPELRGVNLEKYRKQSTNYWKITS